MSTWSIPISNSVFAMSRFAEMSHHGLVGWLLNTADKQEEHPTLFKDAPDWVVGPQRLRQHAAALTQKEDAAKYKDRRSATWSGQRRWSRSTATPPASS